MCDCPVTRGDPFTPAASCCCKRDWFLLLLGRVFRVALLWEIEEPSLRLPSMSGAAPFD